MAFMRLLYEWQATTSDVFYRSPNFALSLFTVLAAHFSYVQLIPRIFPQAIRFISSLMFLFLSVALERQFSLWLVNILSERGQYATSTGLGGCFFAAVRLCGQLVSHEMSRNHFPLSCHSIYTNRIPPSLWRLFIHSRTYTHTHAVHFRG